MACKDERKFQEAAMSLRTLFRRAVWKHIACVKDVYDQNIREKLF